MSTLSGLSVPIPDVDDSVVVVPAPGDGPGHWAGGPSAWLDGTTVYLAYRVRRPVDDGRGFAVTVARSEDGTTFETIAQIARDDFGAASLERPALVRRPDGGWRIYISCATPGSKHWWVDALDAATPDAFDSRHRTTVLPGDEATAMKDPVVALTTEGWEAWVCCHPLTEPGQEDRMTSRRALSADGLTWTWSGEELRGTPGRWDQRGARVTHWFPETGALLYDGRATAEENWQERTGLARFVPGTDPVGESAGPVAESPHASHGLRYATAVAYPDGSHRLYYEAARSDGAHDLRTQVV